MDRSTWLRLLQLEQEFARRGDELGRGRIREVFGISEPMARSIAFALKNKHIIRCQPDTLEVENGDIELVLADLHIPYQDDAAVEAALAWGEKYRPSIITLLGDTIDFYKISTFVKNPKKKSIKEEIIATRKFLINLRLRFPDARIIYYQGNHEERMDKYIMQNAGEIYDLLEGLIEEKLSLRSLKIEYVQDPFRIGKLWHLHGHEKMSGSYNPEYVCNVMFNYIYDHFICGHFHRNQTKPFRQIDGGSFWGGALGYLAGDMDYARLHKWQQGVSLVQYECSGHFRPEIRSIEHGEVY